MPPFVPPSAGSAPTSWSSLGKIWNRYIHSSYCNISVVNPDPVESRTFSLDPELFVMEPDPGKNKK